jgi:hypothetical protein
MSRPNGRIDLQEALFHRDRFLQADYGLGEALERLLDGKGGREDCLEALLVQQSAYADYVRTILVSLQRHRLPGIDGEDDDELTALVG